MIQLHIYIYIYSFSYLLHSGLSWILNPLLYVVEQGHYIYKSWHLLPPTSHSIPSPTSSPLATNRLFSRFTILFLFHRQVHLCHILNFTHKWYHTIFVSFWLTSLSMTISSYTHVAANGIIPFFFMGKLYSIAKPHHIFFMHSYVNGHLVVSLF